MTREKNKNKNESIYLRGIINNLKSQIKHLKKYIKQLENQLNNKKLNKDKKVVKSIPLCPDCGKGELKILDLGKIKYKICSLCEHHEKVKNDES